MLRRKKARRENGATDATQYSEVIDTGGISRREALGIVVGIGAVAAGGPAILGSMFRGKRPVLGAEAPPTTLPQGLDTGTQSVSTTTLGEVPDIIEPEKTEDVTVPPSISETSTTIAEEQLLIKPESLTEGMPLGVLSVTNSSGEVIIPDLMFQANLEGAFYNEELLKGAIMETRRVGINGMTDPSKQQGVLGDKKRITTIFAHRRTKIHENGDPNATIRSVFENLDKVDLGGVCTCTLLDGTVARYECIESKIYKDAQLLKPGGDPSKVHDYSVPNYEVADAIRFQDTDEERIQLVACENGVRDRIALVFRRLTE